MERLILFIMFFIFIYVLYYFLFVRKHLKYEKKKISSDIRVLELYYNINIEKIGYQRVLRILNFINSLMLSLLIMLVYEFDNYLYKFLILLLLILPCLWITYYFLAKYLKHLERVNE